MMYKASRLICAEFDKAKIKYRVIVGDEDREEVWVPFSVTFGPRVNVKFISQDDDNDVAVRVYGLINEIPENRTAVALEMCNKLNNKVRYLKFCLNEDGDISAEYDFPMKNADEKIGAVAVELVVRFMRILDNEYLAFAQALYAETKSEKEEEQDEDKGLSESLLRILEEMREKGLENGENEEESSETEEDLPVFEEFAGDEDTEEDGSV